jgi:hypothetical protein
LPPDQIAAVWTFIARLLKQSAFEQAAQEQDANQLELHIYQLLEHTINALESMRPKDLTTIIMGFAKIVQNIQNAKTTRKINMNQQVFGNVLFDDKSSPNQIIFGELAREANKDLHKFDPRCLSNLAYAFALLGYDPEFENGTTLLQNVTEKSVRCINTFNAQDIANIVWSYAALRVPQPDLFQSVGDTVAIKPNLAEFTPQGFANTVWAFATVNIQHPGLFKKVGDEVVKMDKLKSCDPQNLSNIVWAYATANVNHHALFKKVGDAIVELDSLSSFKPQELSNIVWAYTKANVQHSDLFKKVGTAIMQLDHLTAFDPQALSNTVWAFASADIQYPGLFQRVGYEIVELDDFIEFDPQALSNIAWSYAVANVDVPAVFDDVFTKALLDKQNEFIVDALRQLYQWHLWQTKEMSYCGLPGVLYDRCYQAFINSDESVSDLQEDVVKELALIGLNPVNDFHTESGYKLDALIEFDDKKVGIEVDGPSHFLGRAANGSTLLKRRHVTNIDKVPLVSVPHWEWSELGMDRSSKQQYLRTRLGFSKQF